MIEFTQKPDGTATRVLLLSAHTDDCEVGMGGTISRMVSANCEIEWLTFSNAWQSLPDGFDQDTLLREQTAAAAKLGAPEPHLLDIPVRHFPQYRQDILETLVQKDRDFHPDIVFCPSLQDIHQDHSTLAQEARRAFKRCTLLGYIFPWNVSHEIRNCYIELTQTDVDLKLEAIKAYKSQAHRSYVGETELRTLLQVNGMHISVPFAEMFEVIRVVNKL